MPSDDGLRLDDEERRAPAWPATGQPDPEEPVAWSQSRPVDVSPVDGELLAQGSVLKQEVAAIGKGLAELDD